MKKKIFLPIIDNGMGLSRTSWALSMIASIGWLRDRFEIDLQSISYPYPDGAMNIATQCFLESDADEMLVIDTDVVFDVHHLEFLFSHDVHVVFGLYPKKKPGLEFPVQAIDDRNPFGGKNPLVEVARVARGFMRIHRRVFESIKPHVEKISCAETRREQWLFWKTLPGGHSEDFAFCDLIRSKGFPVLVDQRITTKHAGSAVYPIPGTY